MLDPNPMPPGLHQHSIIVKTRDRDIAFTATTRERHELWYAAIEYLLARPDGAAAAPTAASTPTSRRNPSAARLRSKTLTGAGDQPSDFFGVPDHLYSFGAASMSDSKLTPRAAPAYYTRTLPKRSTGTFDLTTKRTGTAAGDYHRRSAMLGSPRSLRSISNYGDDDASLEVVSRDEIPPGEGDDNDDGFEGLQNLRACCNGTHDGAQRFSERVDPPARD